MLTFRLVKMGVHELNWLMFSWGLLIIFLKKTRTVLPFRLEYLSPFLVEQAAPFQLACFLIKHNEYFYAPNDKLS